MNRRFRNPVNDLYHAIRKQQLDIVEHLLIRGYVNYGDTLGPSEDYLHIAVKVGSEVIVKMLLNKGLDINATNNNGQNALHYIGPRNKKILKLLLEHGANVDAQDKNGKTLLHFAIKDRCSTTIETLLQHGADINLSDNCGKTALFFTMEYMVKYGCCDLFEIAEQLLSMGANVNAKTIRGITILHIATRTSYEIVEELLKYGANINSKDDNDSTSLHVAAKYGRLEIVELLLKCGAEIDVKDIFGRTALHLASDQCDTEIVMVLLEYGFDINIITETNETPLELANNNRIGHLYSEKVVKILIEQIIKIKMANLHLNSNNLLTFANIVENDFHAECKKEVERMKSEKIGNICINDLLTTNESQLAQYAKQKHIREDLKLKRLYSKSKFPIYYHLIYNNKFRKELERNELLEQGIINFPELPYLCAEKIFNYLSNEDIRNFIRFKSSEDDLNEMFLSFAL